MIETGANALRLAQSHFNRMDMVGTPATTTMRDALKTLLIDLDTNIGLSKFLRIFPFIGGNAATHALELFGYDMTFGGTVTHDANGSTGNGSTGYGDIPIDCLAEMGDNNGSASCYVKSMTDTGASSSNILGAFTGSPSRRFYMGNLGNSMSCAFLVNNFATDQVPPTASPGTVEAQFLAGSLRTGPAIEGYKDGVSLGTSSPGTTNSGGPSCALFSVVNNDTSGHSSYSDAQLAFVHIGLDLTDAEHALLNTAVVAYQVALGRDFSSRVGRYMTAVIAAGGTLTQTQRDAIVALDTAIEGIGESKFHLFYPFAGGTAAAHAIDLMGAFDITWSGTITHNADGVKGNGSTGYGDTGYNPSTQSSVTDAHMGFYAADGTHVASSSSVMGAGGGGDGFDTMFTHGWFDAGTREIFAFSVSNSAEYCPTTTETKHDGHLMATVGAGRVQQRYQDGAAISSGPTASGSGGFKNGNMYILARHAAGSASAFDDRIVKALHVGDDLTDEEATTLFNAIHAYQTAMGREDI